MAIGLIISQGLSTMAPLQNLAKDHLVKDCTRSASALSLVLIQYTDSHRLECPHHNLPHLSR